MIQIITILASIATILVSLRLDARKDAQRFAKGQRINHTKDLLAWAIPTMTIVFAFHLFLVHINEEYVVNEALWKLLGMWVVQYMAMRWQLFDKWLNIMRGLPADYRTRDKSNNAAIIDRVLNVPVFDFRRLAAVMISSYFLLVTIVDYFEVWHPSLAQNIGIAIIVGLAVFGFFFTLKWLRRE